MIDADQLKSLITDDQLKSAEESLLGFLQESLKKIQEHPYLARTLEQLKAGEISEEQAMFRMNQYMIEHPEVVSVLMPPNMDVLIHPDSQASIPNSALFTPSTGGLPRLNPLVEGALIERVQFDDDIPELRTQHLPEGVKPAVPVKTTARDPVAIGKMLGNASDRIEKQIKKHEKTRKEALLADPTLIEDVIHHAALIKMSDEEAMEVALHGSVETDLPAYQRGQVPEPVRTRRPSGSALATMTPQERKEKAFKFFSTTQGRRSAIPVIRELIATSLRGEGLTVEEREYDPKADRQTPIAFHEWSVVLGGAGSTQATFSVIDVSANVLAKVLIKQMKEHPEIRNVILELVPVNEVDVRTVGWAARIISAGTHEGSQTLIRR